MKSRRRATPQLRGTPSAPFGRPLRFALGFGGGAAAMVAMTLLMMKFRTVKSETGIYVQLALAAGLAAGAAAAIPRPA